MPVRSPDARHRKAHATTKPHLIAGLALPTAAAVALMFTATGAAVATSPGGQSVISDRNDTVVAAAQFPAIDSELMRTRHRQAIERATAVARHKQSVVRAAAAARVARSTQRKKLAARALEAKRAAMAHDWQLPITSPVKTSGFGYRWGRLHAGEDYGVPTGTNLASMSSGTVVFAGAQGGYGNLVQIRYWDGTVSYYGHMSSISVNAGEELEPGQVVGQSGNSGHSTGPHLHLEIHPGGGAPIDPLPWLASHNVAT